MNTIIVIIVLMLALPLKAATVYDETILDGVRQAQEGNPLIPPLSITVVFTGTPAPLGDGFLEVTASGDFNLENEFLNIFFDGSFIGTMFHFAGDEVTTTESTSIPQASLSSFASDGMVSVVSKTINTFG